VNEKIFETANDLGEWKDSLVQGLKEGKGNSQITWAGQKITDLAKRDLAKLIELIYSANGKISAEDLKFLLKLVSEVKGLLLALKALKEES
jgi:hypothetical protein